MAQEQNPTDQQHGISPETWERMTQIGRRLGATPHPGAQRIISEASNPNDDPPSEGEGGTKVREPRNPLPPAPLVGALALSVDHED